MLNVLITSASNKVWLIQAFQHAVRKYGGGMVHATDINKDKIALHVADNYFISPESHAPDFISTLIKYCLEEDIKLIIPTRDGELAILAQQRQTFAQNNIKVMVSSYDTIKTCQDKYTFYQFCQKHGIPAISTFLPEHIEQLNFPIFVKPRTGAGANKNELIKSRKKLELFLELYDETIFIIQPYIQGIEVTIDLFSDFNHKIISILPRERIEVQNGESYLTKVMNNEDIIKQSSILANKLKLVGHNTIQCFIEKLTNQIKFIEVNPRYGGGATLGFEAGFHTPEFLIQLLLNDKVDKIPANYHENLTLYKYITPLILEKTDGKVQQYLSSAKTFCIDIDGTICTEYCQYEEAQPITSVINKINQLFEQGHRIILFTSRGYSSKKNWLPLLEKQMKSWGVKYHEIYQGKPFADFYIDNKAIDVLGWI